MRKGIGFVVQGGLEAQLLVKGDRSTHVCNLEHRFEPSHQPRSMDELQLAVSLGDKTAQTAVTDGKVRMRTKPDPPLDRFSAASARDSHKWMLSRERSLPTGRISCFGLEGEVDDAWSPLRCDREHLTTGNHQVSVYGFDGPAPTVAVAHRGQGAGGLAGKAWRGNAHRPLLLCGWASPALLA